jgi:serine/threonine-protein kinase
MLSVAGGVDALHTAGVLHRDLKPANVMLDHTGNAFVCDLGLACHFAPETQTACSHIACGSPLYMAPEAFDGLSSPQGDAYALAGMLFEMLTARPPFVAESVDEVKALHIAAAAPLHELEALSLSEELIAAIARGLHKQRFLRYKTAGHLLRALQQVKEAPRALDAQRRRMAKLVEGHRDDDRARRKTATDALPAQTTFDLIAERARSKRAQRGSS